MKNLRVKQVWHFPLAQYFRHLFLKRSLHYADVAGITEL